MILPAHSRYVVDASVAVKWFTRHGESERDKALALRERHRRRECRLVLPHFGLLEILNALRYSPRGSEADTRAALTALQDLELQLEPLDDNLLQKTLAIAWAYRISLYDGAYVALAERLGCPLLTADEKLSRHMKGHSIVLRLGALDLGS